MNTLAQLEVAIIDRLAKVDVEPGTEHAFALNWATDYALGELGYDDDLSAAATARQAVKAYIADRENRRKGHR